MMNMNSFLFSAKVVPFVDSRVNRILKALCFSIYPILSPAKLARSRARIDKWDKSAAIRASKLGFGLTGRSRGAAFGASWPPSLFSGLRCCSRKTTGDAFSSLDVCGCPTCRQTPGQARLFSQRQAGHNVLELWAQAANRSLPIATYRHGRRTLNRLQWSPVLPSIPRKIECLGFHQRSPKDRSHKRRRHFKGPYFRIRTASAPHADNPLKKRFFILLHHKRRTQWQ
jgi:hypothetical protein